MYSYELKRVLARLKQAEKKGLPAHDSACIKGWIARAKWERERAKDKAIDKEIGVTVGAAVRKAAYAKAISYLLSVSDLLASFEHSIAGPVLSGAD